MELQPDLDEPDGDRIPHEAGLAFADAVDHRVVCKMLELDGRELSDHPGIEPIVQKQVSVSEDWGDIGADRAAVADAPADVAVAEQTFELALARRAASGCLAACP